MSGIHIVGDSGRFDSLLQAWARNGLQFVLHVKPEGGNGARLRELLPNGFLVGRLANNSDMTDSAVQQAYEANPAAAARWIVGRYLPTMQAQPQYNAWQFNNEPVFGNGETRRFRIHRLAEFTRHLIDLANTHGHGVALFAFARGTPEPDEWQHFYEVWRYALSKNASLPPGRKNILCLHQYGAFNRRGAGALFFEEDWHLKRYEKKIRPTLPLDLQQAEYCMGEAGPDGGMDDIRGWTDVYGRDDAGRAACVTDWRIYNNDFLANQAGCKGAAFFTLGQEGGFSTFDVSNDPIAGMLAGVQYQQMKPAATTTPPQPQPTPPPPTGVRMIDLPSNHYSSRQGQRAKYVILHSTATPANGTLESTAQYLKQNDRGVSIHELVGTNTVYRMIADDKAAHHCESETARLPGGEPNYLNNELTWGIEAFQILDTPVAPDVARLLLERVVEVCRRLGIPSNRVLAHREIDPTRRTDPVGINITQFRAAVAVALGEGQAPPDSLTFLRLVKGRQEIANNPTTAFMRAARALGYHNSLGDEVYGTVGGRNTVGQLFASLTGEERIFWAYVGEWDNVQHAPVPTQGAA